MKDFDFKVVDSDAFNSWYHGTLGNAIKEVYHPGSSDQYGSTPDYYTYDYAAVSDGGVRDNLYDISKEQMDQFNTWYHSHHPDFHGPAYQFSKEPGCCHHHHWHDPEVFQASANSKALLASVNPQDTVTPPDGIAHDTAVPSYQAAHATHHLSDAAAAGIGIGTGVGAIAIVGAIGYGIHKQIKKMSDRETIPDPTLAILVENHQSPKDKGQALIEKLKSRNRDRSLSPDEKYLANH